MITDYIRKSYTGLRRTGVPAQHAFGIARAAQDIRTFEAEHVTYLSSGAAQVDLGDGWVYTVDADWDQHADPADADCYSAEDVAAFERDDWFFALIKVTATRGKVSETTYLGGVEVGHYWSRHTLLDAEQQALSAARDYDLFGEARTLAEAVPTCSHCGHPTD